MDKKTTPTQQQRLFNVDKIPKQKKHIIKNNDDYTFDILDVLTAPIITFSTLWADVLPQRLLSIIPLSRMMTLMKGDQLATYAETASYMYTRTLEAPMDTDWVDIYTHVCCKTMEDWYNENQWREVNAPKELNDWQQTKLNRLRQDIYSTRRKIVRQRLREEQKDVPNPSQLTQNTNQTAVQRSLF